jgi:hypothetical protein
MKLIFCTLERGLITQSYKKKEAYETPWPEPASELYRPSDRRLFGDVSTDFCIWKVPRGQHDGSLTAVFSVL